MERLYQLGCLLKNVDEGGLSEGHEGRGLDSLSRCRPRPTVDNRKLAEHVAAAEVGKHHLLPILGRDEHSDDPLGDHVEGLPRVSLMKDEVAFREVASQHPLSDGGADALVETPKELR